MTSPIRKSITASLLCLWLAHSTAVLAAAGPPGPGGNPVGNAAGGRFGNSGMPGREFGQPPEGMRNPAQGWPPPDERSSPGAPENRPGREADAPTVPLNEVVSMVQERFNATVVKTDSVQQSGRLVYRIRLLSADKSKMWTVDVDARTGRVN